MIIILWYKSVIWLPFCTFSVVKTAENRTTTSTTTEEPPQERPSTTESVATTATPSVDNMAFTVIPIAVVCSVLVSLSLVAFLFRRRIWKYRNKIQKEDMVSSKEPLEKDSGPTRRRVGKFFRALSGRKLKDSVNQTWNFFRPVSGRKFKDSANQTSELAKFSANFQTLRRVGPKEHL